MDQRSFPQSATLAATTARNLSSRSTPTASVPQTKASR